MCLIISVLFLGILCYFPIVWLDKDLIRLYLEVYPQGSYYGLKVRLQIKGPGYRLESYQYMSDREQTVA